MKRIITIFLCALLACSLLAVPAFAYSERVESEFFDNRSSGTELSPGEWRFILYEDGTNSPIYEGVHVILDAWTEFEFVSVDGRTFRFVNDRFGDDTGMWDLYCEWDTDEAPFYGYIVLEPYVPVPAPAGSPLEEITDVFSNAGTWIASALASFVAIFWTGSQLTFLGILAVVALALAVVLLVVLLINRWLRLR